ncbi:MAG: Co2+/Mg2+ efflux protein ApaG [Flavobacteriales bacterium]|nr:Co2+/Mg2+ efflux protein ApaG [Flavobacteriales bacterium]
MVKKITRGIQVSVETQFRPEHSQLEENFYFFSYHITICNFTDYAVQLMRRHWVIIDSSGEYREVEGPGVVGQQPVLQPGELYAYQSSCTFRAPIGKMRGTYLFEKLNAREAFEVEIPEFIMVVPSLLN